MRETYVRWTCNVCNAEDITAPDEQPSGWRGYAFSATGVPAGALDIIGHLCSACVKDVDAVVRL